MQFNYPDSQDGLNTVYTELPEFKEAVRALVREEIRAALGALAQTADDCDMPYETPELDSRAYQAGREVAQRALIELKKCWTEGHEFKTIYNEPTVTCRRCLTPVPEPVNPFEKPLDPSCHHAFATDHLPESTITTCQLCEGVKTDDPS